MCTERYRGNPYDGESIWAWKMDNGRLVPLTLEQCKSIILFARVPKFINSLRLSVFKRLRRGTKDWKGDGSHKEPCLLLKTATEAQKRDKRITVSLRVIDKTWQMNLGVAIRLIEGHDGLSPEQKKGLINRNLGWVVSHICGNWKCVNPHHITAEPRKANAMRKTCFEVGRCFNPHKRCFVGMKKSVARQTNAAFQRFFPESAAALNTEEAMPVQGRITHEARRGLITSVPHEADVYIRDYFLEDTEEEEDD